MTIGIYLCVKISSGRVRFPRSAVTVSHSTCFFPSTAKGAGLDVPGTWGL